MMRHKMNQPGKSLGVIGLGGLGHMAVRFGKALGLNVTVFSTSVSKREVALSVLGADRFVVSSNQEQMAVKYIRLIESTFFPDGICNIKVANLSVLFYFVGLMIVTMFFLFFFLFFQALAKSLDFIIDTASGDHPFDPYMSLLKVAGTLVLVGLPSEVKFSPLSLLRGNLAISYLRAS